MCEVYRALQTHFSGRAPRAGNAVFPIGFPCALHEKGFIFFRARTVMAQKPRVFLWFYYGFAWERGSIFFVRALLWLQTYGFPMGFLVFCMKKAFHFFRARTVMAQNLRFSYGFLCVVHEKGVLLF